MKPGDTFTTGHAPNTMRWRITQKATKADLATLKRDVALLGPRIGRQPSEQSVMQAISSLVRLRSEGKIVPVQKREKKTGQQILNPATGRYVLKEGRIGKKIAAASSS